MSSVSKVFRRITVWTVVLIMVPLLVWDDAHGKPGKRGKGPKASETTSAPILMVASGVIKLIALDGSVVEVFRGAKPRTMEARVLYNPETRSAYIFDHDKINRPAVYQADLTRLRVRPYTRLPRLNTFCKGADDAELLTLRKRADFRFDASWEHFCLVLDEGVGGIAIEYVVSVVKRDIEAVIREDPKNLCEEARKVQRSTVSRCPAPPQLHQHPPRPAPKDIKTKGCSVRLRGVAETIVLPGNAPCAVKIIGQTATGRYAAVEFARDEGRVWRFIDTKSGALLDAPDVVMDEETPRSWSPTVDAVILDGVLYNLGKESRVLNRSAIFLPQ